MNWKKLSAPHIAYEAVKREADINDSLGFPRDALPTEMSSARAREVYIERMKTVGHIMIASVIDGTAVFAGYELLQLTKKF